MEHNHGASVLLVIAGAAAYRLWFIVHRGLRVCTYACCLLSLHPWWFHEALIFSDVKQTFCLFFSSWSEVHFWTFGVDVTNQHYCIRLTGQNKRGEKKGQTHIWKDRRKVAIIYFLKAQTPDGCQPFQYLWCTWNSEATNNWLSGKVKYLPTPTEVKVWQIKERINEQRCEKTSISLP